MVLKHGLLIAGGAVGAAALLELAAPAIADAVVPVPPLPNPADHTDAWNAAWASLIAAGPELGTARRRATTLAELAQEQYDQLGGAGMSKAIEWRWLEVWHQAYGAAFEARADATLQAFKSKADLDAWRDHVACDANGSDWSSFGGDTCDPHEATAAKSLAVVLDFARALDGATGPRGLSDLGAAVGAGASGVGSLLGDVFDSVGSMIGNLLGGVLGGIGKGILPLAVIGGGTYLVWRHYR